MNYRNGKPVSLGDRVKLWSKCNGVVVCSIDTGEFAAKYPEKQWGYLKSGIVIETDAGEVLHCMATDEDLELISTAYASCRPQTA